MTAPGRDPVSSCGRGRRRSRSAAAWLANTIRPCSVDEGDRLGHRGEDRLQALLDARAASENRRELSIASAARRASSHDELELVARSYGSPSPSRSTDSAPERAPAREQRRDDRGVVAVGDHEPRVARSPARTSAISARSSRSSSSGSPLRITRATGCSPSGSSGGVRAAVRSPGSSSRRRAAATATSADRAVVVEQVDHAQVREPRHASAARPRASSSGRASSRAPRRPRPAARPRPFFPRPARRWRPRPTPRDCLALVDQLQASTAAEPTGAML